MSVCYRVANRLAIKNVNDQKKNVLTKFPISSQDLDIHDQVAGLVESGCKVFCEPQYKTTDFVILSLFSFLVAGVQEDKRFRGRRTKQKYVKSPVLRSKKKLDDSCFFLPLRPQRLNKKIKATTFWPLWWCLFLCQPPTSTPSRWFSITDISIYLTPSRALTPWFGILWHRYSYPCPITYKVVGKEKHIDWIFTVISWISDDRNIFLNAHETCINSREFSMETLKAMETLLGSAHLLPK